jgi:hypothetical protein
MSTLALSVGLTRLASAGGSVTYVARVLAYSAIGRVVACILGDGAAAEGLGELERI